MGRKQKSIKQLIEETGPTLTSHLIRKLESDGLTPDAARKRVSRRSKDINTIKNITFPRNTRFIYLDSQYNSYDYWTALVRELKQSNSAYYTAIASLLGRGGAVYRPFFDIISGSPDKQKKHISSSTLLGNMLKTNMVRTEYFGDDEIVILNDNISDLSFSYKRLKNNNLLENIILDAIRDWVGRLNFASWNVTKIRRKNDLPKCGSFYFDLCGPSYLFPLKRLRRNTVFPGFFVADVIYGNELDEEHIFYFIKKCITLSNLRNQSPFLPMLIGEHFSDQALHTCRQQGIIATTPRTLFGEDISAALKSLLDTLSNAATIASTNPDKIERLFNKLSSIEGAAGNLRGALFELLVGHMVRSIEGGSIDIGVIVTDSSEQKSAEIDVRLVKERKVSIYECKGYHPDTIVTEEEISYWINNRIPIIRSAHTQELRFRNSEFNFQFWTCGSFDKKAISLLNNARNNTTKYSIQWLDKDGLQKYCNQIHAPGIKKIINEHYLKHPLSKIK